MSAWTTTLARACYTFLSSDGRHDIQGSLQHAPAQSTCITELWRPISCNRVHTDSWRQLVMGRCTHPRIVSLSSAAVSKVPGMQGKPLALCSVAMCTCIRRPGAGAAASARAAGVRGTAGALPPCSRLLGTAAGGGRPVSAVVGHMAPVVSQPHIFRHSTCR